MPSVGMRRTTRVFGVVKGADSARVLRSGRHLWPEESGEGKLRRGTEGDDWPKKPVKNNSSNASPCAVAKTKQEVVDDVSVNNDDGNNGIKELVKQRARKGRCLNGPDRFFGIVYRRKRKRMVAETESSVLSAGEGIAKVETDDSKMFGLQFSRRQRRKSHQCVLSVVVKRSRGGSDLFSGVLLSMLRYVRRFRLTLKDLSAFVLSEPICSSYASRGIQFLQGSPVANAGICHFFRITQFMPLFYVDFSAVPLCFKYLHSAMLLRPMLRSSFLVYNPVYVHYDVEEEVNFPKFRIEPQISCDSFKKAPLEGRTIAPDDIEINNGSSLHASVKGFRLAGRNGQYKNVNSKSTQRRRTSLRKRKARNPSLMDRSYGSLATDLKDGQKKSICGVASNKKLRSLANNCTTVSFAEASSAMVDSREGLDSSLCHANLLITESDKFSRVEGAVVTLEMSASGEWLLAVKKDGLRRCTLKAEKAMRPCSSHRYTHVIMFSLDNGWKLEFANRQDWIVFKELYKECSDRNIPASVSKFIPVPGVRDVSDYADSNSVPFSRPDTYISANGDELSRAMTRMTANYDMDSEDEEWLRKFNNEFQEHVSEDNFELIVDALEKAYYCSPDDCYDEKLAANHCQDLGSKEAVEAVYSYWRRKRKQKCSSLLRVFQGHQSRMAPLIPKPLLRKRRSFKRQPSQCGRGKHPSVLQAIAAKKDALEEKNAMLKVDEAKASANEAKEFAIQKRKWAQSLMKNADLAVYKATMLVRIAEAAQAGESVDVIAGYILD